VLWVKQLLINVPIFNRCDLIWMAPVLFLLGVAMMLIPSRTHRKRYFSVYLFATAIKIEHLLTSGDAMSAGGSPKMFMDRLR
jgi:hypothetical protein